MSVVVSVLDGFVNTLWQVAAVAFLVWMPLRFIRRVNAATTTFHANGVVEQSSLIPAVTTETALVRAEPRPEAVWPWVLLVVWAAILLWRIARILRSYVYVRGVKRRAKAAGDRVPYLARRAAVLVSSETRSPMAAGFLHPAIVLPESMLAELSGLEREHVMLHEAAHLAGYDDWTNLALRILGGVFALHPVAVWILTQIEREREMACDDWVVARTGSARPYAESLVHLMELRHVQRYPEVAVGIFGTKSRIGRRVETLLDPGRTFSACASRRGTLASVAGLGMLLLGGSLFPRWIALAQDSGAVPDWETKAGGKVAFEVASVKPTTVFRGPTFALDAGPSYKFTGGHFSATFQLITYITFAYRMTLAPEQRRAVMASLPKWAASDMFDIEARAATGSPTKDQMRLMVRSLLEERFHLAVHFETPTVPIFELRLAKPGRLGPKLVPREDSQVCSDEPAENNGRRAPPCENFMMLRRPDGMSTAGSRNMTMEMLAGAIPTFGTVSRPVVDRTGLEGRFDFTLEWMPETNGAPVPNGDLAPQDPAGPSFLDALREQLGLKLEPGKSPIRVLVVDQIERPSAN